MLKFYCEEAGRALAELKSTPDGLTDAEAARAAGRKKAPTSWPKEKRSQRCSAFCSS